MREELRNLPQNLFGGESHLPQGMLKDEFAPKTPKLTQLGKNMYNIFEKKNLKHVLNLRPETSPSSFKMDS